MPHNGLPLLPPQRDLETRPVLKRCVGARAALAELKQAATLLPNPTILINTLPLLDRVNRDGSDFRAVVQVCSVASAHLPNPVAYAQGFYWVAHDR